MDDAGSPLQNRVTPFGEIVAFPQRGLFTGNRGIIHDPQSRTLLRKRWATKRWLICLCTFKDRRRAPMAAGRWTALFFLDEATALAAGHRPCFECRRDDAEAFRAAWMGDSSVPMPGVDTIDAVLHDERLDGKAQRLRAITGHWSSLPDGAMIAAGWSAWLILGGRALRWSPAGYEAAGSPERPMLLTPPSTVAALRRGYRPALHPTATSIGRPIDGGPRDDPGSKLHRD